jgi:hypothetical protein
MIKNGLSNLAKGWGWAWLDKLKVYQKYFETASDEAPLVLHRGYALALVKLVEKYQEENGAMAEKHADKDIAIAKFMHIVTQQEEAITLYKLQETIFLERLKKQTLQLKEMKQNSRLINFYKMAEENLALAQEIEWYKEMLKEGTTV